MFGLVETQKNAYIKMRVSLSPRIVEMRAFVSSPQIKPAFGVKNASRKASVVVPKADAKDGLTYKAAGVDIEAGNALVERLKKLNPEIGGFSGLFPFGKASVVYLLNAHGRSNDCSTFIYNKIRIPMTMHTAPCV